MPDHQSFGLQIFLFSIARSLGAVVLYIFFHFPLFYPIQHPTNVRLSRLSIHSETESRHK